MLRRNFIVLIFSIFSVVLWGCGASSGGTQASGDSAAAGQTMYTTSNIWYEKPQKIFPLFHKGVMIPVGTKVTITDLSGSSLSFEKGGIQYRMYSKKYYQMSGDDMMNKYFSKTNPTAKGGQFHKFTKKEQKAIKSGKLVVGMSRDAAIMSYGLPPTHVNPDVNADTWQVWENRWNRLIVSFNKNKISNIKD